MFEAITIVKVRKAQNITVPAGGWMIIGTPDQPLHDQIRQRQALIIHGNTSDDYERLLIGRIQDSQKPVTFVTPAESEAMKKRLADHGKSLEKSNADAIQRQKDQVTLQATKAEKDHKARVEALNHSHDAIRGRDGAASPAGPPALPGERNEADELGEKSMEEIADLVNSLNADPKRKNKITFPQTATKQEIIAAILEGTKVDAEKSPGLFKRLFGNK